MRYLWLICVLSAIVSFVVFQYIPEGIELPIHWGADGAPDRYSPAWKGIFIPPALMVVMTGLFSALKWVEPRAENLQKSLRARDGFALAVVLMMIVIQAGTIGAVMGYEISNLRLVLFAGGLGLLVMGNFMGKTRSNFFIGLQTPWTLASETVWRKTHRFGGKLQILAGALMMTGALMLSEIIFKYVAFGIVLPVILIPAAYSWWLWRQEQAVGDDSESKSG